MILEERKKAFIELGNLLEVQLKATEDGSASDGFSIALNKARQKNQWFTPESIRMSLEALITWFNREALDKWLEPYALQMEDHKKAKEVGVIMAGNIPMVGFHDLLSVLLSGNKIQAKCAAVDAELIPAVCNLLLAIEPRFNESIRFVSRLEKPDAVIATGGNNSARYFEYYFSKIPHIIRKNRNAVAVLDGNESTADLQELGKDIFYYFGLGCRNVSKLYIPDGYNFNAFFKAMENYSSVMQHNKYMNNYDYHNTLFLLNSEKFLTNNFLIVRENKLLATPVSVLHYEFYDDKQSLNKRLADDIDSIQCIIGKGFIPFGKSQSPALNDYADGVDVMQFLLSLKE